MELTIDALSMTAKAAYEDGAEGGYWEFGTEDYSRVFAMKTREGLPLVQQSAAGAHPPSLMGFPSRHTPDRPGWRFVTTAKGKPLSPRA